MRPLFRFVPVLAVAALSAGCPSTPTPPPADASPPATATAPSATTATNGTATANGGDAGEDATADASPGDEDCTRPAPKAVLDPARAGKHAFTPGVGPRAVETATLDGDVRVRIQHTGCVHLVERYAFTLPKETHAPADAAFWLKRAAELLRALPVVADRAKETARWASVLDSRRAAKKPYQPGDTIEVVEGAAWLTVSARPTHAGSTLEIVYDVSL